MMNLKRKWTLLAIPLLSALISQTSFAQNFYKWVDEKGATHYTQTPPPQQPIKKVAVNPRLPADSANAIKNLNDQTKKDLKDTTNNEIAAEKTKQNATADIDRRNKNSAACDQIKANLALIQSGQRIRTLDANGERTYLTEEQKAAQIKEQTAQIKNNCP